MKRMELTVQNSTLYYSTETAAEYGTIRMHNQAVQHPFPFRNPNMLVRMQTEVS